MIAEPTLNQFELEPFIWGDTKYIIFVFRNSDVLLVI